MATYQQYEVVIVNLEPALGGEMKKIRPCLIVSPNEMNKHLNTITICPITSQSKNYPTRIQFLLEGQDNWIVIDQIRTIAKERIIKKIAEIEPSTIQIVKKIIQETFVD